MWPGFKSRRRSHTWVEFVVGSLPCSERFLSGYSGFPLSSKPTLPNSYSIWNARTRLNEFIWTRKCSLGKQITIFNFTNDVWEKENALYLSVNILSSKVLIGYIIFTSASRELGPPFYVVMIIRAMRGCNCLQALTSFLSYFKILIIGRVLGIEPTTFRSVVKRAQKFHTDDTSLSTPG